MSIVCELTHQVKLRTELPTRLSHRLRDLQSLPYIVASNPHMAHVNELYFEAFESIRKFPRIESLEDNDRFCQFMQKTVSFFRALLWVLVLTLQSVSSTFTGSSYQKSVALFPSCVMRCLILNRSIQLAIG